MPTTTTQIQSQVQFSIGQSTKVISNFIKTFLSEILFQRDCLHGEHFRSINMSGMNLHVIKSDTNVTQYENKNETENKINSSIVSRLYRQLKNYLNGIDDAIQKKYLSLIIIAFHDPQKSESHNFDTIIEAYEIHIRYLQNDDLQLSLWFDSDRSDNQPASQAEFKMSDIKDSLQSIFRSMISYSSILPPLPNDVYLTLKLAYTPETPSDYEPAGFEPCFPIGGKHYKSMPLNELGNADIKYHASAVMFRSTSIRNEDEVATEQLSTISGIHDAENSENVEPSNISQTEKAQHKIQSRKRKREDISVSSREPSQTVHDPVILNRLHDTSDIYLSIVLYTISQPGECVTISKIARKFPKVNKVQIAKIINRMIEDGIVERELVNKRMGRKIIPDEQLRKSLEKHLKGIEKPRSLRKRRTIEKRMEYPQFQKDRSKENSSRMDMEYLEETFDSNNSNLQDPDEFSFDPNFTQSSATKIPNLVPKELPRRIRLQKGKET